MDGVEDGLFVGIEGAGRNDYDILLMIDAVQFVGQLEF